MTGLYSWDIMALQKNFFLNREIISKKETSDYKNVIIIKFSFSQFVMKMNKIANFAKKKSFKYLNTGG